MKTVRVIAIALLLIAGGLIGCKQPSRLRPSSPPPPSNLTAEAVSQSTVKLQWIDNSGNEDGFKIYRENNLVTTVGMNVTTCQDTGLEPATTYHYVVKAYNQAGESGASLCTIRTPNPPITVKLDRIGVYDNREDWTRGKDGEVYVGIIVTDGNTIVEKRFPEREGQHYKLAKNETVDIGTIIFAVDEVGDYIRIAAIGYEDDGGPGEMLLYQALGAAGEAYISGGAATLLEMTDFSLGNLLAKLFGAEDDWLGSYEDSWDSNNNWGIGRYRDVACEDERGIQCLRLWFTIESSMEPLAPGPTSSLTTEQFYLVTKDGVQVACPKGWESSPSSELYAVSKSDSIRITVSVQQAASKELYNELVTKGEFVRITVGGYTTYKRELYFYILGQVKVEEYRIVKDGRECLIMFWCDVDKLGAYEPIFDYVLDSFKFL